MASCELGGCELLEGSGTPARPFGADASRPAVRALLQAPFSISDFADDSNMPPAFGFVSAVTKCCPSGPRVASDPPGVR